MATNNKKTGNVIYISHGGGPLPLLGDKSHAEMIETLQSIVSLIEKPSAIVVISAHWEESKPTVTTGTSPRLIYDYYGFPPESYNIQYPAKGDPILADRLLKMLESAGINAIGDSQRGFDHGLFIPLKIMYPDADIPCIQLSLMSNLNPAEHIKIGKSLKEILNEKVLIIGSGFSFHNLRAFFQSPTSESQSKNIQFDEWLVQTISNNNLGEEEREKALIRWEEAPGARYCHPREEHLLPLHVCYGICGTAAKNTFRLEIMGKKACAFLW